MAILHNIKCCLRGTCQLSVTLPMRGPGKIDTFSVSNTPTLSTWNMIVNSKSQCPNDEQIYFSLQYNNLVHVECVNYPSQWPTALKGVPGKQVYTFFCTNLKVQTITFAGTRAVRLQNMTICVSTCVYS